MTQANDGGQCALAGFLFQLLGSAAHAAEVLETRPCQDGDVDATFAILKLESHGQDAEIISTKEGGQETRILVQFKYSGNPLRYPIEPKELIEILEGFRSSEALANKSAKLPTEFLLMTNRQLTENAESVITKGRSGQECDPLDVVEEMVNGEKKHKGRTTTHNTEYRSILKRLQPESVDWDSCRRDLAVRAHAFGILEEELPIAINRLIGTFFQRASSAGNRTITASELEQELVGFRDPRRLKDDAVRNMIVDAISHRKSCLEWPKNKILPRGDALFQKSLLLSRALVIICGKGGTGKSVAACQIMEHALSSTPRPFDFVAADSARDITEHWVAGLVSSWRNTQQTSLCTESTPIAINRLVAAVPGPMPILMLAIDGVDEDGLDNRAIRRLVQHFFKQDQRCQASGEKPEAVLLITCRDPHEVYSEWIYEGGFSSQSDGSNILRLDEFSEAELCELANSALCDDRVASRIRWTISESDRTLYSAAEAMSCDAPRMAYSAVYADSRSVAGDVPRVVHPEIIKALRHPGLWRFFSENLDANEQDKVLDRDTACLRKLCQFFLKWLCQKAKRRRHSIPEDITRMIVCAVASRFADPERTGSIDGDWNQPAQMVTSCALSLAVQVLKEAESLGLVLKVGERHWKWQHPFMCQHLATLQT